MGEAEVAALLARGDLERVEADPVTARREIAAATRHVESASRLAAHAAGGWAHPVDFLGPLKGSAPTRQSDLVTLFGDVFRLHVRIRTPTACLRPGFDRHAIHGPGGIEVEPKPGCSDSGRIRRWHTMAPVTSQSRIGTTLRALVPRAVEEIVGVADPVRVILFGSVARGEEGPDSDLDFLVVLEKVEPGQPRRQWMREIRRAVTVDAPVDIFVTDVGECIRRRDVSGSIHYWPMREGEIVYERAA